MSPTETAVRAYAAAWEEPDPARRAELIDACWAVDGRLVTYGGGLRGRVALAKAIADKFADPRGLTARIVGAVDTKGPIFRFRAELGYGDGTVLEVFDAGEVDAEGRIATLITFNGPMP